MSTNWITLQSSDLNDYLVGAQAAAVRTAALAAGQADTFAVVAADVVNRIRSEIRGNHANIVSLTPGTIPPDLKSTAMALVIETLGTRLSIALKLNDDQKKAADNARDYLKRIARGEVVITEPTDPLTPDDQERGAPVTVVSADRRRYTRRSLRGIL